MARKWFTEAHQIFRDSIRRFIEKEVAPNMERWEEQRDVPREVWKKMGEQGFLCPWIPVAYGGAGADFSYAFVVQEEFARSTCLGLTTGVRVSGDITAPYIFRHAPEDLKKRILPGCVSGDVILAVGMTEPGCGSDLSTLRTTALKDGDDYVINGQKTFISNGIHCDWVVLAVRTDPQAEPAHRGVSLVLVPADAPGFSKGRKLNKMGMHSQDTAELIFEDCRIPQSHLMGEEGKGFKYLMEGLQRERLVSLITVPVLAQGMLGMTVEYAKSRMVFGKPVASHQYNAFRIAEMATEIELARTMVDSLLEDFMEGQDITLRVSMCKWWATEMLNRVAYGCVQLHGGYGFMEEYPICRLYRDVRMWTITAGTTEIMKRIIAGALGL